MLNNMSQKELVHWMAFFRIENEEYDARKEERKEERQAASVKVNQVKPEATQMQKDQALLQQLLALSAN